MSHGPLDGVRIVELAALGPAPFACMVLADLGADVLRIDRADRARGAPDSIPERAAPEFDVLNRGRRSVALDLKHPEGRAALLRLAEGADALVEGFRPGVVERLGVGPDDCRERNPRLVYARMTGWGQSGPLAGTASHDINGIALSGALHAIGREGQPPTPPLALVGDFGGGGMSLAVGLVAALFEAQRSGEGQVIDAAMVDGASLLMTHVHGLRHVGIWRDERGTNRIDSGAPFYDTYETADGRFMAVGAIEPHFYQLLLRLLELDGEPLPDQMDRSGWPQLRRRFAETFLARTQAEWTQRLERTDACVTPVLAPGDAADHPHHRERESFIRVDGVLQPAPAPRFSRTPGAVRRSPPRPGEHTREALGEWGFAGDEVERLLAGGAAVATGD